MANLAGRRPARDHGARYGPAGAGVHRGARQPHPRGRDHLVDGIRVTKVARTLLDLAEVLTLDQLVEAIDHATNARHLRPALMSSMIKQSRGRRGLKPLKQALLITRPQDVLTRSELERRALRLLAKAGVPIPEVTVHLHGYEVDLLWRYEGSLSNSTAASTTTATPAWSAMLGAPAT